MRMLPALTTKTIKNTISSKFESVPKYSNYNYISTLCGMKTIHFEKMLRLHQPLSSSPSSAVTSFSSATKLQNTTTTEENTFKEFKQRTPSNICSKLSFHSNTNNKNMKFQQSRFITPFFHGTHSTRISSHPSMVHTINSLRKHSTDNNSSIKNPKTKKKRKQGQKVTTLSLTSQKRHGHKITMVTAYDYPSAMHVARAGIDVLLVGDSCAMVELGYETTQPMTLEQMLHHCQAVKRGIDVGDSSNGGSGGKVGKPLLVGDMPLGTYEYNDLDVALRNAYRMVKEGGMDAVKLEGGSVARAKTVQQVVDGGVAVMGHVGLTPQAISVIGGFRAQGRTATRARALLDEALRLQDAGAFAIVLECVPANVARSITETLEVPTIGIGAGNGTSGQVLVYHDMLGMMSHPHHDQFMPKFCKQYAQVGHAITEGLEDFKREVEEGTFPGEEYSPYIMTDTEKEAFDALLEKDAKERIEKHEEAAVRLTQADEYEQLSLYGGKDDD